MDQASISTTIAPSLIAPATGAAATKAVRRGVFPLVPLALTFGFLIFSCLPRVQANPRLTWAFYGVAGALLFWQAILWGVNKSLGRAATIELVRPIRSHYVQACVQFSILAWWGWYTREVYLQAPLIVAQLLFLYNLEALLTWSRGRAWRPGFGPMPIIFSTNLLLWFRDDWYIFQFVMIIIGALGKQFLTWNRDGRRTHIFNPSAFGQAVIALFLIAIGRTAEWTYGKEIAQTFEAPHILIVIFLGGLVVQYLFHVTLMTVSAVATLVAINLIYTDLTGVYMFVSINVAAPIFLGVHLLVTDPATSPKTNLGRVLFGVLYGVGYAVLFRVLDLAGVPLFWDKLLPVPLLNLCVPFIDRATRAGLIGRFNQRWEMALAPARLNLVHMAVWAMLFVAMLATGFVEGPHPGNSIPFWKKALAEGKPHAGHSLVILAGSQALAGGSGDATNELGYIVATGMVQDVEKNRARAAHYFAMASERGSLAGSINVAIQFLFLKERLTDDAVLRAFDHLEKNCRDGIDWHVAYLLGAAHEVGRGRPRDSARAAYYYTACGPENLYAAKGLARLALTGSNPRVDLRSVVPTLETAVKTGDAESAWYLAFLHHLGIGVARDEARARNLLQFACKQGGDYACRAATQAEWPPFAKPRMLVPDWVTAYPLP